MQHSCKNLRSSSEPLLDWRRGAEQSAPYTPLSPSATTTLVFYKKNFIRTGPKRNVKMSKCPPLLQVNKESNFHVHLLVESFCIVFQTSRLQAFGICIVFQTTTSRLQAQPYSCFALNFQSNFRLGGGESFMEAKAQGSLLMNLCYIFRSLKSLGGGICSLGLPDVATDLRRIDNLGTAFI